MKNQKSKIFKIFLVFLITYNLQLTMLSSLYAKDDKKLVDLSKQVIEAKAPDALYAPLEEIKQIYFKDNKYSEFVEFLKSLAAKKKTLEPFTNYYIALSRYQQLKYLEEKQLWDEYFAQGNTYRDELTTAAQKTIDTTSPKEPLNIYSRLILWQFHRDQQDAFNEQALAHLMGSVSEYAKEAKNFQVIKEVADKLSGYQEKAKAKELYRLYVNKLISSGISDAEVKSAALSFYKGNQLDLAEGLYDVYIGRIIETEKKEKVIPVLLGLAKDFAYQDDGPSDPFYAEKIFQKIEELGGKDIFNEELIYLRAFNLEKAKEYPAAKDAYLKLVERFPGTSHADEAEYKIAIIYTYILRDTKAGKAYFEKLAQKEAISPQVISGLYQLGLLSQWQEDLVKAKEYYDKLLAQVKDGFQDTVTLAKERLKEIDEAKPLEYNLKTFLDVSLKEENVIFNMTKVDLRSHPGRAKRDDSVNISSTAFAGESGCMQVETQYLWSGHLGKITPTSDLSTFDTAYNYSGTKEINLVVVSPSGIIDRNLDLIDIVN